MKTIKLLSLIIISVLFFANTENVQAQFKAKTESIKIKTSVKCGSCKAKIEENMAFVKGVKAVSVDVNTKITTIVYKPGVTNPKILRNELAKLGYDADDVKAIIKPTKKKSKKECKEESKKKSGCC